MSQMQHSSARPQLKKKDTTNNHLKIHTTMACNCDTKTVFNHYEKEKDKLGSEFDDFGYEIYTDTDGVEHKIHFHQHLGLYESYIHHYEDIPREWKYQSTRFIDNTLFSEIQAKYSLGEVIGYEKEPPRRHKRSRTKKSVQVVKENPIVIPPLKPVSINMDDFPAL